MAIHPKSYYLSLLQTWSLETDERECCYKHVEEGGALDIRKESWGSGQTGTSVEGIVSSLISPPAILCQMIPLNWRQPTSQDTFLCTFFFQPPRSFDYNYAFSFQTHDQRKTFIQNTLIIILVNWKKFSIKNTVWCAFLEIDPGNNLLVNRLWQSKVLWHD